VLFRSEKVGQHDGAIFYTVGQRHGLNAGGGLPYYVVGKDMAQNIVYVSRDLENQAFWRQEITIMQTLWRAEIDPNKIYQVRLRHRAPLINAKITQINLTQKNLSKKYIIQLEKPERAVASGQSAVLYDGEICVGGGIIM
jgi:tRNA-specific 2-thiouridylase